MMKNTLEPGQVEFFESPEGLAKWIGELQTILDTDRIVVVTDSTVWDLWHYIIPSDFEAIQLRPGEGSKTLASAECIWRQFTTLGLTRRSVVLNFGGGVVSDIGGFCAVTFKRGLRFINIPTTVLAMADAAIGGKTGVDFDGLKNEIGVFAMPAITAVCPPIADTLPRREFIAGMAEVVKTSLLTDSGLYGKLLEPGALDNPNLRTEAIIRAATTKQQIVAQDPLDKGLRRILNLGHTFGHAYESLALKNGVSLLHGEAVAHGILDALRLSTTLLGLDSNCADDYKEHFLDRYFPKMPKEIKNNKLLRDIISHDKKSEARGQVAAILLKEIGMPVIKNIRIDSLFAEQ